MAEYKTYTCDKCDEHGALRLQFKVDTDDDPVDGHRSIVNGYADLCHFHAVDQLQKLIHPLDMDQQRTLWKQINTRK